PKQEYLLPLLELLTPGQSAEQRQEMLDDLLYLLGYAEAPMIQEVLHNQVGEQLHGSLRESLNQNQSLLGHHLEAFEQLLDLIEPKILEYDKGFPVIYLEAEDTRLLKQLLGPDKQLHQSFRVEAGGYEIPLTRIQSLEVMVQIINELNEGARLLQGYVDRHLNQPEGWELLDFYRVEDFVSYAWEIADRLLYNSQLCKAVPALKRTLLRMMTVCWGIRYILENQTRETSEVSFQNILERKGKESRADINCSVAVYMGMLARQFLRSQVLARIERGYTLYQRAAGLLAKHHEVLNTVQESYYYKKELANLHFDVANLSLACQEISARAQQTFKPAMQQAASCYSAVVDEEHIFFQGLSEQRAHHLRMFHVLSQCWTQPRLPKAAALIEALSPGQQLDESYWGTQIARAMAYSTLALRTHGSEAGEYRQAGLKALEQAGLVPGFGERTEQERASEFLLQALHMDPVRLKVPL
ncbi:MAG TPA: hypothetical protein V6D23_15860, partial [Candidatus Obscuribacterales bacterium]